MESRKGFEVLQAEFPGASMEPVEVVIVGDPESPNVAQGIERLRATLIADATFMGEAGVQAAADLTVLSVVVGENPTAGRLRTRCGRFGVTTSPRLSQAPGSSWAPTY